MTEECITPLRRRMIEDMSVRHFASKTQHDYIRTVVKLTRFLGRSPDTATDEDLRRFQLHLTENRAGAPIINSTVWALRFFFTVTLGRADAARHLTFVHEPRKLPVVLSPEEVARLLEAAPGIKYKAALSVAYGAGSPGHHWSGRDRQSTAIAEPPCPSVNGVLIKVVASKVSKMIASFPFDLAIASH